MAFPGTNVAAERLFSSGALRFFPSPLFQNAHINFCFYYSSYRQLTVTCFQINAVNFLKLKKAAYSHFSLYFPVQLKSDLHHDQSAGHEDIATKLTTMEMSFFNLLLYSCFLNDQINSFIYSFINCLLRR